MAKKKKKDRLNLIGLISTILKHRAQQRSMEKAREKRAARRQPRVKQPKVKKPKDTRTPEQIHREVESTRAELVATVGRIKYDLDVPARGRDLRDRLARQIPTGWRGEPQAALVALSVLVTGIGSIAWGAVSRARK